MAPLEILLLLIIPLTAFAALLIGFLAALRGLQGDERVTIFRVFVRALRR
ncbi:hypothetical protein [Streptomyces sp. NPDC001678]